MSEEDLELERLKAKRLAEMQQNISTLKKTKEPKSEKREKPDPRNIVLKSLGFRGQEVLEAAESQFPNETRTIVSQLAQLIQSGELTEIIDGGQLLALFRTVGLRIRMNTKINVEQDGKFVSLSEKLTNTKNSDV